MFYLKLFLPFFVFHLCTTLECYDGTKIIGSGSKKKCEHASDFCYNMTVALARFPEVIVAGCSNMGCRLSQNRCIEKKFRGRRVTFCCCNHFDLCNSKFTYLNKREKMKQEAKDLGKIGKTIGRDLGKIGERIGRDLGIIKKGTGRQQ
ncbi:unnamed protein product [Cylicocyclus nassatus]|uniref:Uncharacterized protein n=1 Tax=Cylicocyclus nassatus TaxID=53992 RepID=A0AA36DUY6_CYLNA|nr:unnamed protein product [Cylicocyclus nassatus]